MKFHHLLEGILCMRHEHYIWIYANKKEKEFKYWLRKIRLKFWNKIIDNDLDNFMALKSLNYTVSFASNHLFSNKWTDSCR